MNLQALSHLLVHLSRRSAVRPILVAVAILALAGGWLLAAPTQAAAAPYMAAGLAGGLLQDGEGPGAAPAANAGEAQNTPRGSPILGILVLLAPFVFLIWKSRGKKSAEIKSAACLPLIDESKRPFALDQDEGEGGDKPKG